jgi:two-component system, cell cycle response regulator
MTDNQSPLLYEEAYKKLRDGFRSRLESSVESLKNILIQKQSELFSINDLKLVQKMAHNLSGTGTIFGFPEVTEAGQKADLFLEKILKNAPVEKILSEAELGTMLEMLANIKNACEKALAAEAKPLASHIEQAPDAGRFTVMIVDNDHLILHLLEGKYKDRGFRVLLAEDGKKAWDNITKNHPDLVILDRMLPGLDGLAVLKNMRQEEGTRNIPVVILSARGEQRDIDISLKMGAQEYVVKPFMPDDLLTLSLKLLKEAAG